MRDPKFLTEDFLSFLLLIFFFTYECLGGLRYMYRMESDFDLEFSVGSLASP